MKKERKTIGLGFIALNEGQLEWLPKNPRKWTQSDVDKTAASIKQDPDFLEDRPLLVVPFNDKDYIVFAGNLRHEGSYAAELSKVPCVVYYPESETDFETIRRRAMKDNGSFGQFDWDEVFTSPWGGMDLEAMGIGRAFERAADGAGSGASGTSGGGLPPELEGVDIEPEELEDIEGDDQTAMERVIICYKKSQAKALGEFLAMAGEPEKVVYKFNGDTLV